MPILSLSLLTAPAMMHAMLSTPVASAMNLVGAPLVTVEEGLEKTVQWYLDNEDWWRPLLIRSASSENVWAILMKVKFRIVSARYLTFLDSRAPLNACHKQLNLDLRLL